MVARGDLGVEMALEEVPMVQRDIIAECRRQAQRSARVERGAGPCGDGRAARGARGVSAGARGGRGGPWWWRRRCWRA
jgi:hypothetical protein